MKRYITLLSLIFISIYSMAYACNWDKTDKVLFGTFTSAMIVDCLQTNYSHEPAPNPLNSYYEHNPIIKAGVKEFGKGFIPVYFGGYILGGWYISDKLKSRNRKILLSAIILLEVIVINDNKSKGIGLNFNQKKGKNNDKTRQRGLQSNGYIDNSPLGPGEAVVTPVCTQKRNHRWN